MAAWNWYGVPGILAMVVALAMAGLIYFARPTRAQNAWLAAAIAFEGPALGLGAGIMYMLTDVDAARTLQLGTCIAVALIPAFYLPFLGTLDTPLARPFRGRGRHVALAVSLAFVAAILLAPSFFVAGMEPAWYAPWDQQAGPGFYLLMLLHTATSIFALVVSVSALRRARSEVARRQAKAYVVAFGVRDALTAAMTFAPAFQPWLAPEAPAWDLVWSIAPPFILMIYLPVLAYGILRTQLFGIDLRVKLGLRHALVALALLLPALGAALLVRSTLAQDVLGVGTQWAFGWIAGILVAGALLLGLAPVRRLAERATDALMPGVAPTPEYLDGRRREIYRLAVESVVEDGETTRSGRRELDRLRARIGLDAGTAEALERDARAATASSRPRGAGPAAATDEPATQA